MKTVLAIMGSPRKKGDTWHIVNYIEEKLNSRGDINFQYIYLKDSCLEYCRGCLLCMRKGEDACPTKDSAAELRKQLMSADGIIFASPVYVHQVTALMKNFFDRFAYFMHRPAFHGKPALLVTTTEISGAPETLEYLRFCAEAWGLTVAGSVWALSDGMKIECRYKTKILDETAAAAERFSRALEKPVLPAPTVRSLQFFRKLRTKVIIHREKLPYDYMYWKEKGWLQKPFFYDTRVGFFTRIFAAAPVLFIIIRMKFKLGGDLFRKLFLEPMRSHKL
jgi:multimeric flavodoxin WrbA